MNITTKMNITTPVMPTTGMNHTIEDAYFNMPPEIPYDENAYHLQHFIDNLNLYFLPVIVFVGGIGNTLSLYVILVSHLRHQSSNIYLAFLSIVDTGFLIFLFLVWIDFLEENTVFPRNGFCQVIPFITYVFSFLSVYTVVSFTVERFIITFHPLQRQRLCTTGRAKMVVGGLSIFALLYYSFPLYMSTVITSGEARACLPKEYFMKAAFILSGIDTILTLLLPLIVIITLNIAISVKITHIFSRRNTLRLGRQFRGSMSSKNGFDTGVTSVRTDRNSDESERSLSRTVSLVQMNSVNSREGNTFHAGSIQARTTRTLLILSSTFVVLNLPSHVLRVYVFIISLTGTHLTIDQTQNLLASQDLVQFVYYTNFACNFFLYTLCSKAFRDAAKCHVWSKLKTKMIRLKRRMKGEHWQVEEEVSVLDQELKRFHAPCEKVSSVSKV